MRMNRHSFSSALILIALMALTSFAQEAPRQDTLKQEPAKQTVAQSPSQVETAAGNQEVLDLLKAGMSTNVIIAKVKATQAKLDASPAALQLLKTAGAADEIILAVIEASVPKKAESVPTAAKRRVTDELTTRFKELQLSVVTVWSEVGHGTGFIFDERGLVMTNQHVIGPSEIVSVQFDQKTRVSARILAADPQKDVAVLWVDMASLPGVIVARFAKGTEEEPTLIEGERVMTIGSPLNQRKIMTTGIASKIEAHAIISDININHGNSGGPLFNSIGEVVGITTFGDFTNQGGPGISGIVRIEETASVVELAIGKMALTEKPEARLLPVDPTDKYPLDAIRDVVEAKKFDFKPYSFVEADFNVTFITPLMRYRLQSEADREAAKTKNKRNNSKDAVQSTFAASDEFRNWAEYVGEYKPVLIIQAQPLLGESFWGAVGRGVAANYGIRTQANLRFKTDFYRMKLFCGDTEVAPINPGKIFYLTNERNAFVKSNDATYAGFYSYPADAINDTCGTARLELYSEKHPEKAEIRTLNTKTIARIITDFQPYFMSKSATDDALAKSRHAEISVSGSPLNERTSVQGGSQFGRNGVALYQQGKVREAEVALNEAVKTDPNNVVYRRLLGLSLLEQNKWGLAEIQLREAVRLDPSDHEVHNSLGVALANQHKLNEAEVELREALRLSPKNVEYEKHLTIVLANQSK